MQTATARKPDIELGCYAPHPKQVEFLRLFQRRVPGVSKLHAIAGGGGGKTIAGILAILESCLTYNRGMPHLWSAPTYRMAQRIFLPTWKAIVPRELYRYVASDERIEVEGGAWIWLVARDRDPDRVRGITVVGAFNDEVAFDRSRYFWDLVQGRIRHPVARKAGQLWCASITTPKLGWHQRVIQDGGDPVVKWTSLDNPWADPDAIEQMREQLGPAMYAQEVLADYIAQHGRIWGNWSDEEYPLGNRWKGRHNHRQPYVLAVDLGIRSSWQLIQTHGDVDVVTAEYTPTNEGAAQTLNRIDAEYGRPSKVIVGSDVNTRSVGDASRPSLYFRQRWGEGVNIVSPTGSAADKQAQHHVLDGRILNTLGDRRFCVATELVSHDSTQQNKRGVLEVMNEDQWPDDPRRGEYLIKEGILEHARDSILYFAMCQHPPHHVMQPGHPA